MPDTASFSQYKRISGTAAGTTVVMNRNGSLERIILGSNKTGTISFYDVASSDGTASTNFIMAIDNTSGTIPSSVECGFRVKAGLVAVTGGTTDILAVYN